MVCVIYKMLEKAAAYDRSQVDILCSDAGIRRLSFSASGRRHQSHYQRWQHPGKTTRAILRVMNSTYDLSQLWKHSWKDENTEMKEWDQ